MKAPELLEEFVRRFDAQDQALRPENDGYYRGSGPAAPRAAWATFCALIGVQVEAQFSRDGVTYDVLPVDDLVFSANLSTDLPELVFLRQFYCDHQGETYQGLRLHVELPGPVDLPDDELWVTRDSSEDPREWISQVSARPAFALLDSAGTFVVGWAEIG